MTRYDPGKMELAKRSDLVYALFREITEGRGPIMMDIRHLSEEEFNETENIIQLGIMQRLKGAGIDYRNEMFEWISPAIHTFLGGAMIDRDCATNVPGLFASGENAGGVYGADRVGTYLTACVVFGLRSGNAAARYAMDNTLEPIDEKHLNRKMDELGTRKQQKGSVSSDQIEKSIRRTANECIAFDRNEEGLRRAMQVYGEILSSTLDSIAVSDSAEFIRLMEIRNLALTGKLVAESALLREESRGQHKRSDYPDRSEEQLVWIIQKKAEGESQNIQGTKMPIGKV